MRLFTHSRFIRLGQDGDRWSVRSVLLLPIMIPVYLTQIVLIGGLVLLIILVMADFTSAIGQVTRVFREAMTNGLTDRDNSTRMKGGEFRQTGDRRKGFLIRHGGSLSNDDLRCRLYELRTTGSGRTACRARNGGSQYGKQ